LCPKRRFFVPCEFFLSGVATLKKTRQGQLIGDKKMRNGQGFDISSSLSVFSEIEKYRREIFEFFSKIQK
jgi:hypothetical protein